MNSRIFFWSVTSAVGDGLGVGVGAGVGVQFSFTDKGVNDGPWSYAVAWGDGTGRTTGTATL